MVATLTNAPPRVEGTTESPPASEQSIPMTYEEYLASPEEMRRYDILDGWKVYRLYGAKQLPNPTVEHQEIQGNLYVPFRNFARSTRLGSLEQTESYLR